MVKIKIISDKYNKKYKNKRLKTKVFFTANFSTLNSQLSTFSFQFSIFNFSDLGVPASRRAFRYIFLR